MDALFSMGNINTFQSIATGVRLVLEAFERDRFEEAHFQPLQRLTDNLLRFQDRIVYGTYVGFRSPALLELWFTLWGLTDGARVREVLKPLVRYARTGRMDDLTAYDARPEDVLTGFGQATEIDPAEAVLDRLDEFCDIMQELEDGRSTLAEAETRLRAAMEADERYDMLIDAITDGLGRHPWIFEPLRRHGVRAYSTAFLTPDEVLTLGVSESDVSTDAKRRRSPMQELREHADNLEHELRAQRERAGDLLRALEAERGHAATLREERDAHGVHVEALTAELDATREVADAGARECEALVRDRDAWRGRAESGAPRGLMAQVKQSLRRQPRSSTSDAGRS